MEISNEYTVSWVDIGFDNSDNIRGVYLLETTAKMLTIPQKIKEKQRN